LIISVIKKRILLPFQANISLVTELYVMKYYRIVDDVVIVSGHNLGTAPIEDAINEHPAVAESAIVGPHDIKGNALYGFVILKETGESRDREI
jgi:acyl-CoA synthetase (AMP-forming)/AMP-acid ligase II